MPDCLNCPGRPPCNRGAHEQGEESHGPEGLRVGHALRRRVLEEPVRPGPETAARRTGDHERRHHHREDGELDRLNELVTVSEAVKGRYRYTHSRQAGGQRAQPAELSQPGHGTPLGSPGSHRVGPRWKNSQKQTSRKKPSGIARVMTCGPRK